MFDEWLQISRIHRLHSSAKLSKCYMNSPHVTKKMPATNGYRSQGKTKHFFKSHNLLSIRVPHKFHLFVSYNGYSYHRIEVDVMCSVQDINVSGFKKWDKNGIHQGQKKVVLFSEFCWEQIFFHLPADIYTYLIPKNNEQTNKNKN